MDQTGGNIVRGRSAASTRLTYGYGTASSIAFKPLSFIVENLFSVSASRAEQEYVVAIKFGESYDNGEWRHQRRRGPILIHIQASVWTILPLEGQWFRQNHGWSFLRPILLRTIRMDSQNWNNHWYYYSTWIRPPTMGDEPPRLWNIFVIYTYASKNQGLLHNNIGLQFLAYHFSNVTIRLVMVLMLHIESSTGCISVPIIMPPSVLAFSLARISCIFAA